MQSGARNVETLSRAKPSTISNFAAAEHFLYYKICAVDGGHDYLRRCGNLEDWEELSKAEKVEDNSVLN